MWHILPSAQSTFIQTILPNSFPPSFYNKVKNQSWNFPKEYQADLQMNHPADGKTWVFACFADINILQGSYALKNFHNYGGGGI